MTDTPTTPNLALHWHPFTPQGIAGAVGAPRWQLWSALAMTAAASLFSVVFFLMHCWQPVIVDAIDRLDDGGFVRAGILHPGGENTDLMLANNRFLAIALNWTDTGPRDQASDVRLILQIDRALVCSVLGCAVMRYETIGDHPVGRTETGAWWRAWSPFLLVAVATGQTLFILVSWWLLVIVYAWVVRLLAFYLERQVDFGGATRVAQAALVPGALWLTAAVFLYAHGWLDLFGLLIVWVVHVPVGWIYLGLAGRHLPRRSDLPPANPFESVQTPASSAAADPTNPFQSPRE